MSGNHVLLVDDEEEFTSALSERMEARGLRVKTAASGTEAIDLVKSLRFDAIILDLAMPGLNGIETLKRLRQINPDLQIILLTGRATVKDGVEAMKLGAVDLLEKPANLNVLMEKIAGASSTQESLTQQRIDDQLKEIMRKKGW